MPNAEAHVETDRASRYLVQLCRHAGQMGQHLRYRPLAHHGGRVPPEVQHVEWSDSHGIISFGRGRCTIQATPDALTLRVEAADEETLQRLQEGVAHRLETIGRRDNLKVNWQRPEAPEAEPGQATGMALSPEGGAVKRRGRVMTIGLISVGVLIVALHLGLGGAVLATPPWMGWAANALLAVVLVKVLIIAGHVVPARLAIRRLQRRNTFHPGGAG
jgi:hypothetical protein